MPGGPDFLKEKYNLHASGEVNTAAQRTEQQSGEKVPQDSDARIRNYLDRLERLALDPKQEQQSSSARKEQPTWLQGKSRPRAISLLREMVMNEYVRPNKEKMAEGAARVEERAAREMGIEAHYGEQELQERGEIAVENLERSLDNWILYLSDKNEPYPTWFRYYAFRNILDLGDFDKDKREFTKRSQGSTRLFPDIDRGALGYMRDVIGAANGETDEKGRPLLERLQQAQRAAANQNIPESELLTKEKAVRFAKLSFAKQYAEGMRQAGEITPEMRAVTEGTWVKYSRGTDPTALWASLQNKGTAWCTKGFATAETQLKGGDFYVYYTLDKQGKPTIPRIAIRMQETLEGLTNPNVGEVRGVADNQQNLEGNMVQIAEEKMNGLPGAERYRKASADMKQLTAIEKKTKSGEELSKDDLAFLYEINASIEGFGYKKDPRIAELRRERNPEEDMLVIFECSKDQIARVPSEIKEHTKAYVGQLNPGIFQKLPERLEHIYTSFPEKKIRREKVEIGGKSAEQLISELEAAGIHISDYAKEMLKSHEFVPGDTREEATLIRLTVADLGFGPSATTDQIYERAEKLGLELCPADTGPNYRLQYQNQPLNEGVYIGMKQIADRDGDPHVFKLVRNVGGLRLKSVWAYPEFTWRPVSQIVFRFRKLEPSNP